MLKLWKLLPALAFVFMLSACGGSGDSTAKGAIAFSPATFDGAIVVNYTSQAEANSEAIFDCGLGTCSVVLEFSGNGTCGSIAISPNGAWGVDIGGDKESADGRAVAACQRRGGTGCVIPAWLQTQCN